MGCMETLAVTHYEGPATLGARDQPGERNVHATIRIWRELEQEPDDPYGLPPYDVLRWEVEVKDGDFPPPVGECTITCPGLGDGRAVVDEVGAVLGERGWIGKLTGYGPAPGMA